MQNLRKERLQKDYKIEYHLLSFFDRDLRKFYDSEAELKLEFEHLTDSYLPLEKLISSLKVIDATTESRMLKLTALRLFFTNPNVSAEILLKYILKFPVFVCNNPAFEMILLEIPDPNLKVMYDLFKVTDKEQ